MSRITRRQFIKKIGAVGATGLLSFGPGLSFAQSLCATRKSVLVVIHLGGGVHSLSVLPPRQLQEYHDKHPNLGIQNPLALTNAVGLHPALSNLHRMYTGEWAEFGCTFFQNVGILNEQGVDVNSRSHEIGTQQYAAGLTNPDGNIRSGWLGRYAALHCTGNSAVYSLVNIGGIGRTLAGNQVFPLSFGALSQMNHVNDGFNGAAVSGANTTSANRHVRSIIQSLLNEEMAANEHQQLYQITHNKAEDAIGLLTTVRNSYTAPPVDTYRTGNPLNQRFMDAAALINRWDLTKTSLICLQQGGYDTHSNQGNTALDLNGNFTGSLSRLLKDLDDGIAGFFRDLQNRGLHNDVCVMITSEFGRTFENANRNDAGILVPGTDHGTGGFCAVMGANVNRLIGFYDYSPQYFTTPQRIWLPALLDFRNIYSEILRQHLGVDPVPIFPESFVNVNLPIFV